MLGQSVESLGAGADPKICRRDSIQGRIEPWGGGPIRHPLGDIHKIARLVFPKMRYHQITHFNRVFHYKPSILGYHNLRKHPDGGNSIFLNSHPENLGDMISQFDEHIVQRGWFNHQPDCFLCCFFLEGNLNQCPVFRIPEGILEIDRSLKHLVGYYETDVCI